MVLPGPSRNRLPAGRKNGAVDGAEGSNVSLCDQRGPFWLHGCLQANWQIPSGASAHLHPPRQSDLTFGDPGCSLQIMRKNTITEKDRTELQVPRNRRGPAFLEKAVSWECSLPDYPSKGKMEKGKCILHGFFAVHSAGTSALDKKLQRLCIR